LEPARERLAVSHVLAARVGRHREAGRHGDSELGHLGQADALAAEKLSSSAGRLVEVEDEASVPSHCAGSSHTARGITQLRHGARHRHETVTNDPQFLRKPCSEGAFGRTARCQTRGRKNPRLGRMELGDFWERQAEAWVRWAREPGHDSYWLFHRDRFLELLPRPGRLTVDVGCGEGRLSRELKELGHTVLAVDRSPTMVRHAREADPELEVREGDAALLPVDDGAADLVVSFMSLMNTDDLEAAVREAARVLEPGGRYCIA